MTLLLEKTISKSLLSESKKFTILNSLYADGINNKLPKDILIKLIKLFSFDLDFQRDIRVERLYQYHMTITILSKTIVINTKI